jgi:hypothetical protein
MRGSRVCPRSTFDIPGRAIYDFRTMRASAVQTISP